jgi:hypothetical protein
MPEIIHTIQLKEYTPNLIYRTVYIIKYNESKMKQKEAN